MKQLSLIFSFLALAFCVQAQSQLTVDGLVFDANGNPLATTVYLTIETCDSSSTVYDQVQSSPNGYFSSVYGTCDWGTVTATIYCGNTPVSSSFAFQIDPNTGSANVTLNLTCPNQNNCFASFTSTPDSLGGYYFSSAVTGGNAPYTYFWNFGDGGSSTSSNPYHQYAQSGQYSVGLTVTDANGDICNAYDSVWVNNPSGDCNISFNYQVDPNNVAYFNATVNGGNAPYTLYWDFDEGQGSQLGGENVTYQYNNGGYYYVCVTAYDNLQGVCTYCDTVNVNSQNTPCNASFYAYQDTLGSNSWWFDGSVTGGAAPYTYFWDFGDNQISTQEDPYHQFNGPGPYAVYLTVTDANGNTCTTSDTIGGTPPNICNINFTTQVDADNNAYFDATVGGGTAPYDFYWDFGNNQGSVLAVEDPIYGYFFTGSYYVCVTAVDADGYSCTYCDVVDVNDEQCLDWDLINLGAYCPGYDPVCGCDGITYDNACIAEECFGVAIYTPGPCGTNNPPVDSCTAEFLYFGLATDSTGTSWDLYFFGDGLNVDEYSWDFGDGNTGYGQEVSHTYNFANDTIGAFTVCLTAFSWADSCEATICETIIIDGDPNGQIGGSVSEEGQRVIRNGAGDPIVGAIVRLLAPNGQELETTLTDINGEFVFNSLLFGDYQIQLMLPSQNHTPHPVTLSPITQIGDIDFIVGPNGITTGINDAPVLLSGLNAYPNPFSDQLTLSIGMDEAHDATISVSSLIGQTVQQQNWTLQSGSNELSIDMKGYPKGLYLISVQLESGERITQKILKQ